MEKKSLFVIALLLLTVAIHGQTIEEMARSINEKITTDSTDEEKNIAVFNILKSFFESNSNISYKELLKENLANQELYNIEQKINYTVEEIKKSINFYLVLTINLDGPKETNEKIITRAVTLSALKSFSN